MDKDLGWYDDIIIIGSAILVILAIMNLCGLSSVDFAVVFANAHTPWTVNQANEHFHATDSSVPEPQAGLQAGSTTERPRESWFFGPSSATRTDSKEASLRVQLHSGLVPNDSQADIANVTQFGALGDGVVSDFAPRPFDKGGQRLVE